MGLTGEIGRLCRQKVFTRLWQGGLLWGSSVGIIVLYCFEWFWQLGLIPMFFESPNKARSQEICLLLAYGSRNNSSLPPGSQMESVAVGREHVNYWRFINAYNTGSLQIYLPVIRRVVEDNILRWSSSSG